MSDISASSHHLLDPYISDEIHRITSYQNNTTINEIY